MLAFGHKFSSGLLELRFWQLKKWMVSKSRMCGYMVALGYDFWQGIFEVMFFQLKDRMMCKLRMCGGVVAFGHDFSSGLLELRNCQPKEWMMRKLRTCGYVVAFGYEFWSGILELRFVRLTSLSWEGAWAVQCMCSSFEERQFGVAFWAGLGVLLGRLSRVVSTGDVWICVPKWCRIWFEVKWMCGWV